jgi:hypothetical protein
MRSKAGVDPKKDNRARGLREIADTALDPEKSSRLRAAAYHLMGLYPELEEQRIETKNEDAKVRHICQVHDLESYLDDLEYRPACVSKLNTKVLQRFWIVTKIDAPMRLRLWKVLAATEAKIRQAPQYYSSLVRLYDPGLAEFEDIIQLDVKRTAELLGSEDFAKKLTRVLFAYAK